MSPTLSPADSVLPNFPPRPRANFSYVIVSGSIVGPTCVIMCIPCVYCTRVCCILQVKSRTTLILLISVNLYYHIVIMKQVEFCKIDFAFDFIAFDCDIKDEEN